LTENLQHAGVWRQPTLPSVDFSRDHIHRRGPDNAAIALPDHSARDHYFNAGQVLLTPASGSSIDGVEALAGRTVAVEWGSQADMEGRRLEKEIAGVALLRQPTAREAIEALLAGQADAAIVDAVSGVSAVPGGLRIVTYLTDEWYAAAVHIDSRELLEAVNQTLTRLQESGRMAEMQARWLHSGN